MRISGFKIEDFKSISDTGYCKISENDNIVVLAGQNEAGKSAVIEALDFFGNGPSKNFEKLHRRQEKDPVVTVEFALSPEDIENIFIETDNEDLKQFLIRNNTIELMRCINDEDTFDSVFFSDKTEGTLRKFFKKNEEPEAVESSPDATPVGDGAAQTPTENKVERPAKMTFDGFQEFIVGEKRKVS